MSPVLPSILAIVAYLFCGAYLMRHFLNKTNPAKAVFLLAGLSGAALHATAVLPQLLTPEGLALSFFNAASLISLFIVLLVLACIQSLAANLMLAPFQLLASLAIAGALLIPAGPVVPVDEAPGVLAHILLSILAYGVLSIAVLQSLILLFQDQQLRKRPVSAWIRNFPPLQSMENLMFSLLWGGWVLLGLSLLTGWLYLDDLFARHVAHKTFFSCLAWVVFATLLWGRHQLGWRGHKAIRLSLAGFILLMLAYFGSKLVREFILIA